jgi:membrane protein YqaA with SNARE-associated domain
VIEHLFFSGFRFFARLGGFGLLGLGILDSSFLFMPLGNDLLVVILTARKPHLLPYYAAMAMAGSVLGSLIVDFTSRKLGEAGLAKRVPKKRLDSIRSKFEKHAASSLIFATLMPPPFPFTVFVMVAAALEYSRKRLMAAIAAGRIVRFTLIGLLAVFYGRHIIRYSKLPAVRWAVIGLAVLSIGGSAWSIYKGARPSRSDKPVNQPA